MTGCRDRAKHEDAQQQFLHQQQASFHVDRISRYWLAAFVLLGLLPWSTTARRTRRYDMPSRECSVSQVRPVTGAAILSSTHHIDAASSPCMLKFNADENQAQSSKRIQIITEKFNITDCNTSLWLFYDTVTSNHPDYKFDCHSGIPPPLFTHGQHLTLLLRDPTEKGFDFRLIITGFKTVTKHKSGLCDDLVCGHDEDLKCIHEDLGCDGYKNCEDGEDEMDCPPPHYNGGSGQNGMLKSQLFRWGMKGFIGMVLGAVTFVVLSIVIGVACCHLRGMTGSTVRGGYIPAHASNNTNSTATETILARLPCLKFLGYANPQTESGYSPQHGQGKGEPGTVGYQAGVEKVNMTPH